MTKLFELDSQRRDAILNAALKEFSSRGYDNASTNVIAKEAKISKALMFHYVGSKQELFFVVYDYFTDLMEKEYFELMNYNDKDIFDRLHQSYLLQIRLLEKYPWITEFNKLSRTTNSDEINKELEKRVQHLNCFPNLFDKIDEAKFRKELDIEKCKQFVLWVNIGFTNQILSELRNNDVNTANPKAIFEKIDGYLDELRKIFYTSSNE